MLDSLVVFGWKHRTLFATVVFAVVVALSIAGLHGKLLAATLDKSNTAQLSYLKVKYEVEFLPVNARLYNAGIHFADTGTVQSGCSYSLLPTRTETLCNYGAQTKAVGWTLATARDWQLYSLNTYDYLTETGWEPVQPITKTDFAHAFDTTYQKVWFAWTKRVSSSTTCALSISNTSILGLAVYETCYSAT